jgi:hypothetical protein
MRTILYSLTLALLVALSGCAKFTDVDPKGKNLLGTVTDLDQLLNYDFTAGNLHLGTPNVVSYLTNDCYPDMEDLQNLINAEVKTISSVLLAWDEETDRAPLAFNDGFYEECYAVIGRVANPVLLLADDAVGNRDVAQRLKAEARVLRAYFHYLLVNFYAKAYDPATAAADGGVPYVKEGALLSVPREKHTVQQVYDFILEDLQAAFELNSLANRPTNQCRVGKAFAHAVEARALMSMHRFEEAATAAGNSLAIEDVLVDQHEFLVDGKNVLQEDGTWIRHAELKNPEDLFYFGGWGILFKGCTQDFLAAFETGSIFYEYSPKLDPMYSEIFFGTPDVQIIHEEKTYPNFAGLTTVDMHLTLAECKIRAGAVGDAMGILNKIRETRVDPYVAIPTTNAADAFALLENITRTETWYTIRHFMNVKRWNTEADRAKTLRRTLFGKDYELTPGSPLWIFPFPRNATQYNPNLMKQNYEE